MIPTVEFLYFGQGHRFYLFIKEQFVRIQNDLGFFQRNNSESFQSPILICFYLISSLLLAVIPIIEFKGKIYSILSGTTSKCSRITVNLK